jgi:benzoylformate decarboxylase
MGNLVAAYHGTPPDRHRGTAARELMIGEPYLGNREATTMPKPWVKWSYEPYRAEDVPEAFMRAYAMARSRRTGPVFLSIHLDDWNQPRPAPPLPDGERPVRPDAERLRLFADRISASRRPALVFGPEVDRSGGWDAAIALAEKLRAAVYGSPLLGPGLLPEDHPCSAGRSGCR